MDTNSCLISLRLLIYSVFFEGSIGSLHWKEIEVSFRFLLFILMSLPHVREASSSLWLTLLSFCTQEWDTRNGLGTLSGPESCCLGLLCRVMGPWLQSMPSCPFHCRNQMSFLKDCLISFSGRSWAALPNWWELMVGSLKAQHLKSPSSILPTPLVLHLRWRDLEPFWGSPGWNIIFSAHSPSGHKCIYHSLSIAHLPSTYNILLAEFSSSHYICPVSWNSFFYRFFQGLQRK